MLADALKEAHHERWAWIEAVMADGSLTLAEKVVALRLAAFQNVKTGRCDPSVPEDASVRSVVVSFGRLRQTG